MIDNIGHMFGLQGISSVWVILM